MINEKIVQAIEEAITEEDGWVKVKTKKGKAYIKKAGSACAWVVYKRSGQWVVTNSNLIIVDAVPTRKEAITIAESRDEVFKRLLKNMARISLMARMDEPAKKLKEISKRFK